MKKITKMQIFQYAFLIVAFIAAIVVFKIFEDNTNILYILLGALVAIIIPVMLISDKKINDTKKEEQKDRTKEEEKEFIEKVTQKQNENSTFEAMYLIATKQSEKINSVIKNNILKLSFDFNVKDNYYEVAISSESLKKKDFFYSSFCAENTFLSNDDETIDIWLMSAEEIIDLLYNEAKKYLDSKKQ